MFRQISRFFLKGFSTRLEIEGRLLEQVSKTKLLGLLVRDDLTWHENTENIVHKAYQRMSILRNLFDFNLPVIELLDVYILYIRSVIEQSSVVWSSSITVEERQDIERIQKVALRIILKENYVSYENVLCITGLLTLQERRLQLSRNFAKKCVNS